MIQRHLLISCLALTVMLAGCSGTNSNSMVSYAPENLGLDPLDQVIPLADPDHKNLDNEFLTYLQGVQQSGDDANWQAKPYDHYVTESGFKASGD
jgi:hypothetical protein